MTFGAEYIIISLGEFEILLTRRICAAKINKTKEKIKMKKRSSEKTKYVTLAAMIAASYTVLTLVSATLGLSSGVVQVRISEALCTLVVFTPAAVPGLTVGCLISNLLTGANVLDVVFGTLATALGALGGYALRKYKYLTPVPTVVANTLIVPLVIRYGFGVTDTALPIVALGVLAGEIISAAALGIALLVTLEKYRFKP